MRLRSAAFAAALLCAFSPTHALPADASTTIGAVSISGKEVLDTRELTVSSDGDVWLDADVWKSLQGLRLELAGLAGPVSARSLGLEVRFDSATQSYELTPPAHLLPRQILAGKTRSRVLEVSPQPRGALINYDLAASIDDRGRASLSAAHDVRAGLGAGTLVSTGQVNATSSGGEYRRGLTTWHLDDHRHGITVGLGDVFTPRSTLSSSVNLGGLRIASDRELRSDQDFLPVPLIGGIADTRTAAEIWVNERNAGRAAVNAGPWDLGSVPTLPGLNDIRLALRDEFGREEIVSQRFYQTPKLLPSGRYEWDMSFGAVRSQDSYDSPALAARFERGLLPGWTAGTAIEATEDAWNASISNRIGLGGAGVLSFDLARSSSPAGSGASAAVSYEFRGRNWSTNLTRAQSSDDYWQLAHERSSGQVFGRIRSSTSAGLSISPRGALWSVSAAGAKVDYHSGMSRQRVDLTARFRLGRGDLGAGVGRDLETGEQSAYFSYRYALGGGAMVSATARRAPDPIYQVQASGRTHIGDQRVRWLVSGEDRDTGSTVRGGAAASTRFGDASLAADHSQHGTRANGRFAGSLWVGEGGVLAQRTSQGSFALVEVPGQIGVPVSGTAGHAGRTNGRGYAVVPYVQSLQPTLIRIDTTSLPGEVSIDSRAKSITSTRRGGAKLKFEVVSEHVVEVLLHRGGVSIEPPASASTDSENGVVGHGGVLVLMSARPGQAIEVSMPDGICEAHLPGELPEIGERPEIECVSKNISLQTLAQ